MLRYLVQQPRTLESMALEELGDWIASQAKQMMSPIAELQQRDAAAADAALSRQIGVIRNRLECNVPRVLHDKLAVEAIRALDHLLEDTEHSLGLKKYWELDSDSESDSRMNMIGRMIETLFTKHLTSLTLDYRTLDHIEMFLPTLLTKSNMLDGLIQFHLNHVNFMDYKKNENIVQLLKELHDLKHLSLSLFSFTPKVLQCIADNCKFVETLQFRNDEESCCICIPYETIVILPQLPNLRSIDIYGDPVGYPAIIELLSLCQNIEHIGLERHPDRSVDIHDDEIASALQEIASKHNAGKQFKLKSYKVSRGTTLAQLQLVVQMCPLIEKMILKHWHWLDTTIPLEQAGMVIHKLQNLRRLELRNYDFYEHQVKKVLQIRGSNLVELSLKSVNSIDLNALMCISQMCPNLECFYVSGCRFKTSINDFFDDKLTQLEIPPFRNLKRLTFCGWLVKDSNLITITQVVLFLLSDCLNIEFITIASCLLGKDIMLNVLDINPMICLKELRLETDRNNTSKITKLVIDRIIQNCSNHPVVIAEKFV